MSHLLQAVAASGWSTRRALVAALCVLAVTPAARRLGAQQASASSPLMSRAELAATAARAEAAAMTGSGADRERSAALAASVRQRLRDGDFQIGDRVIVSSVSDVPHQDTLLVRNGLQLELPGRIIVPLSGVLRSEVKDRVSTELLKYVKAQQIEVTPLTRLGVLGEVARPGYFALASDMPLTDAIMGAGGPATTADVARSTVRRGGEEFRSAAETRLAISQGLTLDQLGLRAGDELIIGKRREMSLGPIVTVLGAVTSVVTLMIALRN